MPRKLFAVVVVKREDGEEPPAATRERASVPVPVSRPFKPAPEKPTRGGDRRRDPWAGGAPGVDARRRRSGASRFRG